MGIKTTYRIILFVGERDISKYTDNYEEAKKILDKAKKAARTLGLLDIFTGEIHEINRNDGHM